MGWMKYFRCLIVCTSCKTVDERVCDFININSYFINMTFVVVLQVARPRGYKTFFVLNSVEHEILNAHKYKNIKKFGLFKAQLSLECYFSRSYMLKCQQLLAF